MPGSTQPTIQISTIRLGRTTIEAVSGSLFEHGADAIVSPSNQRGVMGAGIAGSIRIAGGIEVERAAMARAPLEIGSAIATISGDLTRYGIRTVIHAVVYDGLGAPTRVDIVRTATEAALRAADRAHARSLLLPPLGVGLGAGRLSSAVAIPAMIEETVAHLRRNACRLDRILLHFRDDREAISAGQLLQEARALWWEVGS